MAAVGGGTDQGCQAVGQGQQGQWVLRAQIARLLQAGQRLVVAPGAGRRHAVQEVQLGRRQLAVGRGSPGAVVGGAPLAHRFRRCCQPLQRTPVLPLHQQAGASPEGFGRVVGRRHWVNFWLVVSIMDEGRWLRSVQLSQAARPQAPKARSGVSCRTQWDTGCLCSSL